MKLFKTAAAVTFVAAAENGWNSDFPKDENGSPIKFLRTSKKDNKSNKIKMEDWFKKEATACKNKYDAQLPIPAWYGFWG